MNNLVKINSKNISIYNLHFKYKLKYDGIVLSKNVDILNSYYNTYCNSNLSIRSFCIQRKDCICGYNIPVNTKPLLFIEIDYFNLFNTYNKSKHTNIWNYYLGFNYVLYKSEGNYILNKIDIKDEH